jgi:hypothetical protein
MDNGLTWCQRFWAGGLTRYLAGTLHVHVFWQSGPRSANHVGSGEVVFKLPTPLLRLATATVGA